MVYLLPHKQRKWIDIFGFLVVLLLLIGFAVNHYFITDQLDSHKEEQTEVDIPFRAIE